MKLGKEEKQKIVLGVLLLSFLLYGYFEMLLGPLKKQRVASATKIEEVTKNLREVRGQIRRAQDLEAALPAAATVVEQVKSMIPEGAPVAWFPPQIAEHFKRDGVNKASARMTSEQPEKDLPGFRRISWTVDFSQVEFVPFAEALARQKLHDQKRLTADFENNEPLAEISSMQMEAGNPNVEFQKAFLNLRTTVTQ